MAAPESYRPGAPLPYGGTCSEIYILIKCYKMKMYNAFEMAAHAPMGEDPRRGAPGISYWVHTRLLMSILKRRGPHHAVTRGTPRAGRAAPGEDDLMGDDLLSGMQQEREQRMKQTNHH